VSHSSKYHRYIWHTVKMARDICLSFSTVCQMYLRYLRLCDTYISCHFYCVSDVPVIFTTVWHIYLMPFLLCVRCTWDIYYCVVHLTHSRNGTRYMCQTVVNISGTSDTQYKWHEIYVSHSSKYHRAISNVCIVYL
jgi:hypothetical protein